MTTETPEIETIDVDLVASRPRTIPAQIRAALRRPEMIFGCGVITGLIVNVGLYLIALANR